MGLGNVGGGGPDIEDGTPVLLNVAAPLEDAEAGQFGPRIKWRFWIWNREGTELLNGPDDDADDDDDPTWWQFTSEAMGKRSKAGKWTAAFLGRELEKGDRGEELAEELYPSDGSGGAWAKATLVRNDNDYLEIGSISPMNGKGSAEPKAKAAKPAAPKAAPKPANKARPVAAAEPEDEDEPEEPEEAAAEDDEAEAAPTPRARGKAPAQPFN